MGLSLQGEQYIFANDKNLSFQANTRIFKIYIGYCKIHNFTKLKGIFR